MYPLFNLAVGPRQSFLPISVLPRSGAGRNPSTNNPCQHILVRPCWRFDPTAEQNSLLPYCAV
jgi:hypothetical protein